MEHFLDWAFRREMAKRITARRLPVLLMAHTETFSPRLWFRSGRRRLPKAPQFRSRRSRGRCPGQGLEQSKAMRAQRSQTGGGRARPGRDQRLRLPASERRPSRASIPLTPSMTLVAGAAGHTMAGAHPQCIPLPRILRPVKRFLGEFEDQGPQSLKIKDCRNGLDVISLRLNRCAPSFKFISLVITVSSLDVVGARRRCRRLCCLDWNKLTDFQVLVLRSSII